MAFMETLRMRDKHFSSWNCRVDKSKKGCIKALGHYNMNRVFSRLILRIEEKLKQFIHVSFTKDYDCCFTFPQYLCPNISAASIIMERYAR